MRVEQAGPDLLTDAIFSVVGDDEPARLSLPGLLARLLAGPEIDSFPEVAAEQRGYWWRFLVRCGARALQSWGSTVDEVMTRDPGELAQELAEALADGVPEGGWCLYQPDAARPGFLQVPAPGGRLDGYTDKGVSALTGLIGSKNHERKAGAFRALTPEQVVYGLIEYQMAANYGGKGHYQSQLMGSRSGQGSGTPFMGARLGSGNQETFRHDVATLQRLFLDPDAPVKGAVWALWCQPWSGDKGAELPSQELDPAFIPLARMVRVGPPVGGRFQQLWFRGTEAGRVLDHTATPVGNELKGGGLLGDPFIPAVQEPMLKVRGTMEDGYSYTEVVRLLFGGDKFLGPSHSVQQLVGQGEVAREDLTVLFEGMAYGQGKTLGFHRREVLLPARGATFLDDPAPVREVHEPLLELVAGAKKALRDAAHIILSGTDDKGRPKRRDSVKARAELPAARLEQQVDGVYLRFLLDAAEMYRTQGAGGEYRAPLLEWLRTTAREVFAATRQGLPCNTNQRLQRELEAERWLQWRLEALAGEKAEAVSSQEGSADE